MSLLCVQTKKGKIEGIQKDGHSAFFGIPYAKAPVGELRFKRPRETEPWQGVFKADCFGNRCLQPGQKEGSFYHKEFWNNPEYLPQESEDCLYLNIWTPAKTAQEKLPVALYIHGGAFVNGAGTNINFDGAAMASRGVILVTINYRLGVFGFFAHPKLKEEDEQGSVGNYAFWDQLAAIDWVKENIAAFGGDPDRLTIFGQSAGSISVQTLCLSPAAKGKFAGAVLQSGILPMGPRSTRTAQEAMQEGEAFCRLLNIDSLDALRAVPAKTLFEEAMKDNRLHFGPILDGAMLTAPFEGAFEKGLYHDIPYMLGSTKDDFFAPRNDSREGKYPAIYGQVLETCALLNQKNTAPAFAYQFARDPLGDDAGAFHSSELWYMFGTLHRSWRPKDKHDYALSETMVTAWTNFFKYGDPGWEPGTLQAFK